MTVAELKAKLANLPPNRQVYIHFEDSDLGSSYFNIDEVAIKRGTSSRAERTGKARFRFEPTGLDECAFVEASPA